MAFKSKDIIQVTEFGESVKDSLTLLEYRLVNSLTSPMRVSQIYKVIIDKYPNDYFKSSLDFYKTIEVLGSKKVIEKVVLENEDKFEDLFKEEDMVEMSTLVSDEVDFINEQEKERRYKRRKERWFSVNKNNYSKNEENIEINMQEDKKLNFKHINLINDSSDDINIPIDNPFYLSDSEKKILEEEKTLKTVSEPSFDEEEGLVISFITEENSDKNKKTELSYEEIEKKRKARKERQRIKEEREKYNKKIKKESLSDKKYVKLREERNIIKLYAQEFINFLKKILKK